MRKNLISLVRRSQRLSATRPNRPPNVFLPFILPVGRSQLKLKLTEINQNPFRQGLLADLDQDDANGDSSFSGDVAEDMSWGFDQSFMENDGEGAGLEDGEDYDDI